MIEENEHARHHAGDAAQAFARSFAVGQDLQWRVVAGS